MSTAVVVPIFNEAWVIGSVVSQLCERFELVVCVDDGSTDLSSRAASAAGGLVLRHAVNLGQGAALRTGFDYALTRDDITHVVTFDADGQHSVDDAEEMLRVAHSSGVDVVLGSRGQARPQGQPLSKRLVLRIALRVSRLTSGLALTDTHNGLRVLNRRALAVLVLRQRGMAHASEIEALIARHHLSWVEHPVTITYTEYSRAKGQGSLNAFNVIFDLVTARLHAS